MPSRFRHLQDTRRCTKLQPSWVLIWTIIALTACGVVQHHLVSSYCVVQGRSHLLASFCRASYPAWQSWQRGPGKSLQPFWTVSQQLTDPVWVQI